MNHYVYYSYEEWGRGYIGVRSCECLPEEDTRYFGSFYDKTFKPTAKTILATFETRESAIAAEISLHAFYQVHVNPHFANKARQTSTKFVSDRKGKPLSQKQKDLLRQMNLGKTHSEETKSKIGAAHKGKKRPEEWVEKIRNAKKGKPNWAMIEAAREANRGRKQSEEEKLRRSSSAKNNSLIAEHLRSLSKAYFKCTVTGHVSTPGPLSSWQKRRGIDPCNRIRLPEGWQPYHKPIND